MRLLTTAGSAAGAGRQRGAHARAVRRAGASAALRRWRGTCGGAGTPRRSASSATSTRRAGAQLDHNPIALLAADPARAARGAGRRDGACTAASTTPTAGCRNISTSTHTWGARARRRALGAAGRLLLGRVRPARVAADLLRRPRRPRRRPHQERRPTWACRWSASACFYDQGYFRQRLDGDGWQQEEYLDVDSRACCRCEPAIDADGKPVTVAIDTRDRHARCARVWRMHGRPRHAATCSTRDVEGNSPEDRELTARLYGGDDAHPHPPGAAAGRRRRPRAARRSASSPGVFHLNEGHSAFAALELIRQRMERRGHRRSTRRSRDVAAQPSSPRTRRCPPATTASRPTWSRSTWARCARRSASRHDDSWASAASNPHERARAVLHDGAGAQAVAPRQRRRRRCTAQVSRAMWTPLCPGAAEEEVPIGHITNGVHVPTWLARQMHQLYDRHLGADWPQRMRRPPSLGSASTTSTTASCGRRTRR